MANKKLARHVTVAGVTYGPGDDVPAEIVEKITNPKAWVPLDANAPAETSDDRDAGTASGHRLATAVTVGGRSFGPNDFVPDDVAAQIRNPKAWQGGQLPAKATPETAEPAEGSSPDDSGDGFGGDTADTKATRTKAAPPAAKR